MDSNSGFLVLAYIIGINEENSHDFLLVWGLNIFCIGQMFVVVTPHNAESTPLAMPHIEELRLPAICNKKRSHCSPLRGKAKSFKTF
jgi:hypothetical protein